MKWFIHPQMLAGLGAVVIPLVLHLLSRARYRSVQWGAMMFLDPTQMRYRQGGRFKQIFLLLLRSAIIALLVLAIARPILGTMPDENSQVTAVILLDRSASMSCDDGGATRFDRAKEAAYRVLASLRRGDRAMILPLGDDSGFRDDQPSTDLQAVAAKLAALTVSPSQADVAEGLRRAEFVLSGAAGQREIYLICDRQAVSFEHVDASLAVQSRNIRLIGFPISELEPENVAVRDIRLNSPVAVRGREVSLSVELQNFSSSRRTLPLSISTDGNEIATRIVTVAPHSSAEVSFRTVFNESGTKIITAAMQSGGSTQDDRLDFALQVIDPINVLLVGNSENELAYPKLALAPYASTGKLGSDLAEVTIARDVPGNLSVFQVVVICNLAFITPEQSHLLQEFIYHGGGVMLAPGLLVHPELYERLAWLPGKLADPTPISFSAVARWKQQVEFSRRFPMQARGQVSEKFDDGSPLATTWSLSRGRVILLAAPLDTSWSNFPTTPQYLPFMQESVAWLAGGRAEQRNVDVGQPLLVHAQSASQDVFIISPDGQEHSLDVHEGVASYRQTSRPGLYKVIGLDRDVQFVVRPPREESDLTPLTPAKWGQLEQMLGMQSAKPGGAGSEPRFPAREIWGPLIVTAVLLMVLELRLARTRGEKP